MESMEVVHIEDVPVEEVWARLQNNANSVLIDVRTRAEWTFVGLPDLKQIGKQILTVEWQTSPDNRIDAAFPERLDGEDHAGSGLDPADVRDRPGAVKRAVAWAGPGRHI